MYIYLYIGPSQGVIHSACKTRLLEAGDMSPPTELIAPISTLTVSELEWGRITLIEF